MCGIGGGKGKGKEGKEQRDQRALSFNPQCHSPTPAESKAKHTSKEQRLHTPAVASLHLDDIYFR